MVNYRRVFREAFKTLCKTEYKSELFLRKNKVYKDIKSKFSISEDKLDEFLKTYEVEKNGKVFYRNPFRYDEFVLSTIEYLLTGGVIQPLGIDYREETQIKEGRTSQDLSVDMQRKFKIKISPGEIRSLVRKSHSTRIKIGADEHFYVSPE